jgi:hypothetical protein
MTTAAITFPVDIQTAQIYNNASVENRYKLQILMNLLLCEFAVSENSLNQLMDEISDKAQIRGLSPEILESILND